MNVFNNIAEMEPLPPASRNIDILEDHVRAWVRLVAANDTGRKDSVEDLNVVERNILDRNQLVSWAVNQRVEHAPWVIRAVRLVLLLRPDVDSPPERLVNLNVVVDDV